VVDAFGKNSHGEGERAEPGGAADKGECCCWPSSSHRLVDRTKHPPSSYMRHCCAAGSCPCVVWVVGELLNLQGTYNTIQYNT
jgi:hypothetical protein